MDKELEKYYASQLEKVIDLNKAERRIKITSDGKETNWLGLNDESAKEIVKYLRTHYKVD